MDMPGPKAPRLVEVIHEEFCRKQVSQEGESCLKAWVDCQEECLFLRRGRRYSHLSKILQ